MKRRREEGYRERGEREAAQQRLGARFWRDWMRRSKPPRFDAEDAFHVITSAVNDQYPVSDNSGSLGFPMIRAEDALDALRVAPAAVLEAQGRIEYAEMELIEIARLKGASWAEIGARYGYETQPGMHARRRYQTLRKQWPGANLSPEDEAAITAPDPTSKETT